MAEIAPRPMSKHYAEFLPAAQAVSEREHSPAARLLIFCVALVVAAALLWAGLSRVERVASAPGQVRPAGSVMNVNHGEGGRVVALRVREGARVVAGEVLLEMDPVLLEAEVAKIKGRQANLMADLARLQAEAEGRPIAFPAELTLSHPELVAAQSKLHEARGKALFAERTAAERVVQQRRSDLVVLDRRIAQLGHSLELLEEQRSTTAKLMDQGYFPKLRYLTLQREVSQATGQFDEARQSRPGALAALAESKQQLAAIEQNWNVEVFEALSTTLDEIEANSRLLAQQETRRRNLVIRAPAAGVVQNLAIKNVGQAVAPNELLMTVVPDAEGIVIEARVPDRDIGYVEIGQPVTIKVRTYDFIRYGTLDGRIERIAADATNDSETQETFFLVQVSADAKTLAVDGTELALAPGMLVDVDFHIGERSILSYLTDRLMTGTATAFTER